MNILKGLPNRLEENGACSQQMGPHNNSDSLCGKHSKLYITKYLSLFHRSFCWPVCPYEKKEKCKVKTAL